MPIAYKFIKETDLTFISENDVITGGDLYYFTENSSTQVRRNHYMLAPTPNETTNFYDTTTAIYQNRRTYSGCKVAFYIYGTIGSRRCGFVFATLKPPEISTSNYRPAIGTTYQDSDFSTTYHTTQVPTNTSNYYDQKTGYKITYSTEWGLSLSSLNDGANVGAGIPVIDLSGVSQNEGLQYILGTVFNDGNWANVRDPYAPAGISETGGGDGAFDDATDIIPIPPLPTESVSDTGFVNIYNPTLTQLKALATYMWTNPAFDLTNWRSLVANPLDSIISLSIVPVAVPNGSTKTITVGNVATTVSMTQAATNYIELNCGTISIDKYWGCYLDYSPYTKISLYLPYIGYNTLNIDEVMGNSLQVVYHIDIFTGGCVAFVLCGGSVLYSFPGNIAYNIPVTGADYSRVISGIVGAVSQGVTAIASGGLTTPLAIGTIASMASTVISSKPNINKGGGISGNVGLLGVQIPYVEIIRPRQALPLNQNVLQGYPSLIYSRLGDLSGYTEVESINLENINATDEEKTELFNLLNSGVIL